MIRLSATRLWLQRGSVLALASRRPFLRAQPNALVESNIRPQCASFVRALSSKSGEEGKKKEGEESTTDEIVLTPGEKVVAATRLGWYLGLASFAAACAYYIGKELIPT
jgi:import inner membrane translocase subunit TIM21